MVPFIARKGLEWTRISLLCILMLALISHVVPDTKLANSTLLDQAMKYNNIFAYIGMFCTILNAILFAIDNKKTYLVAICLFFLNFLLYFAAPTDIDAPAPVLSLVTIFAYIFGMLIILQNGMKTNNMKMDNTKLKLVTRVYKINFEYLSLYLSCIFAGIVFLIGGIHFLYNTSRDTFWLGIMMIGIGIFIITCSTLSLIPKKKKMHE